MESPSYVDLPTEIIMEILLRLPVKTLLRFKCVCNKWYTLIGSQSFINQHFGHESNQEKLLIWHEKPHDNILQFKLGFGFYVDEMYSAHIEEPIPLQGLGEAEFLIGPSNGVFCVRSKSLETKMALLNPAMKQFKPLPLLHQHIEAYFSFKFSSLEFGLDPVSGDYKVVWIQYLRNDASYELHHPPLVYVYNSGSNSWRHLKDVDLVCSMRSLWSLDQYGKYLDGVCYWLMDLKGSHAAIIGFDLTTEKFLEIKVPDYIISPDRFLVHLLNGDSLALLSSGYSDQTGTYRDVWVMQNESCWAIILTLGPSRDFHPFGFWKKNELILGGLTSIFAINISGERLWSVETPKRFTIGMFFHAYKESLYSIKREGDNCMLWDTSSDLVKDYFL